MLLLESDKNNSGKIEPFPEQIKTHMDLMANSLDDSEEELKFDSSIKKKKDINGLKLSNGPDRVRIIHVIYFTVININCFIKCGAPDPIQMLTGNNAGMKIKARYARRYNSDKDLTYGHKKVFMGTTEEELGKKTKKSSKKKKKDSSQSKNSGS